jgi:hypothetical protein
MYIFPFSFIEIHLIEVFLYGTQNVLNIFRNFHVIVRANVPCLLYCVQCTHQTAHSPAQNYLPLISHCISNSNQFQNMSSISPRYLQLSREYKKSSRDGRRDLAISLSRSETDIKNALKNYVESNLLFERFPCSLFEGYQFKFLNEEFGCLFDSLRN